VDRVAALAVSAPEVETLSQWESASLKVLRQKARSGQYTACQNVAAVLNPKRRHARAAPGAPRRGTKLDPGRRLPYFSPVSASRELKRRNFAPPCQEAASRPWLATRDQAGPLPLRTPTAGSRSRTQPRPQSRARPRRSGTRSFGRNRERWPRPLVAPHRSTSDAWTLILMRMMLVIPAMRAM
jgi:hypothetical protein